MNDSTRPGVSTPAWLKWIVLLPLLAGLGIGLWAVLAPLGIWFDWWDFRKGFGILGAANGHALWFVGGCAIVGAIAIGLSIKFSGSVCKAIAFAAIGILCGLGAYYVPQSYRPPAEIPPIHDITTDTQNPPEFVDVLPLRADAPNTVVYGGTEGETPESLAEMQIKAYPDIVPQRFSESEEQVFAKALAAAEQLGWELVAQVPEDGRIEATDTTFWFRFKDDVVIKITREADETVLNARSLSRVGRSDVGKNAERLREFFSLL